MLKSQPLVNTSVLTNWLRNDSNIEKLRSMINDTLLQPVDGEKGKPKYLEGSKSSQYHIEYYHHKFLKAIGEK